LSIKGYYLYIMFLHEKPLFKPLKRLCFISHFLCKKNKRNVCGWVVKDLDFKPLAPHHYGFESWQVHWILSCEEAIQLAYRTLVFLLRWPFVFHGRTPEATRKHGKSPVLCWSKVKPNKLILVDKETCDCWLFYSIGTWMLIL
jgi:hypothetical protein